MGLPGGPSEVVQAFAVDPRECDRDQLQLGGAVALFQIAEVFEDAPIRAAGSFGFFRGEPRQREDRQVRVIVDASLGPHATHPKKSVITDLCFGTAVYQRSALEAAQVTEGRATAERSPSGRGRCCASQSTRLS